MSTATEREGTSRFFGMLRAGQPNRIQTRRFQARFKESIGDGGDPSAPPSPADVKVATSILAKLRDLKPDDFAAAVGSDGLSTLADALEIDSAPSGSAPPKAAPPFAPKATRGTAVLGLQGAELAALNAAMAGGVRTQPVTGHKVEGGKLTLSRMTPTEARARAARGR